MSTSRLYVTTDEQGAARALDLLAELFEEDGYTVASSEIDEKRNIWQASLYLDHEDATAFANAVSVCLEPHFPGIEVETEILPDIDWVSHSLEGLKPVRAGRFLVHGSHDRSEVRPGDIGIEIDAAQAFGTGHHGTTAGCLEMIARVVARIRAGSAAGPVLDLGTGSGVLAIAVANLAPVRVLATDIDPVATRIAAGNARLNRMESRIMAVTATGFHSTAFGESGPFRIIIANILARPLMRMAPDIKANLAPGGSVILSGILAEQRWKVLAAFNAQGLHHVETIWREGWVTIHLR